MKTTADKNYPDLIPAMLAEARREALREVRDNISESCWTIPGNSGTRSYNRGVKDSLSVIDALLDADAPAQSKPDAVRVWQPIETAPRDGAWFLMFRDGREPVVVNWPEPCMIGVWHNINGRWSGSCHGGDGTHWMHLPAPPKDRTHD